MQYHLNAFRAGDPRVLPADPVRAAANAKPLPDKVDVLIVGCGPAGLTLAAQLSAFPDINTRIVEAKPGPIEKGQADGLNVRSMEMFTAFGFADKVKQETYWVNETTFWTPDPANPANIRRVGRVQDVADDQSEMPHTLMNQARVHELYLEHMLNSPSRLQPDYSLAVKDVQIDTSSDDHPVTVTLERTDEARLGEQVTVRANYVVGCDGARSQVRTAIGGELIGDAAHQAWGVMDILANTDFPDIRMKCLIQSKSEGNVLVLPREGGYLFRLYVELDKLNPNERVASKNLTAEHIIAAANRIFNPFTLDVKEVVWWSVYEIGHRICDKYDDVPAEKMHSRQPRVFIAGDACHTHSPKAGQGMNFSMQDSFNLGWKLAAVLRRQCLPDLLHSYSAERQSVGNDLITFDREWAKMISDKPAQNQQGSGGVDPKEFQKYFEKHLSFTAGMGTQYQPSSLTGPSTHQHLASGLLVGMRFHSAPVIRITDAKRVQLGHAAKADGRWRLYAFAGADDHRNDSKGVGALCKFLEQSADSPLRLYTPPGQDIDSVFDLRAIFQQAHHELAIESMPALLLPRKGRYGLRDYEKVFCADPKSEPDIFDLRGIDRTQGCLVLVRPDQYIAHVLPLNAHRELAGFFAGFMLSNQ